MEQQNWDKKIGVFFMFSTRKLSLVRMIVIGIKAEIHVMVEGESGWVICRGIARLYSEVGCSAFFLCGNWLLSSLGS